MAYQSLPIAPLSERATVVPTWLAENVVPASFCRQPDISSASMHLQAATRLLYARTEECIVRAEGHIASAMKDLNSAFEKLPVKVRFKIYRLALGSSEVLHYTLKPPALASVNRRVRDEVLPMFYSESRFNIALAPVPGEWNLFSSLYASAAVRENLARIRVLKYTATVKVEDGEGNAPAWELAVGIDLAGRTYQASIDRIILFCGEPGLDWDSFTDSAFQALAENNNVPRELRRELPIRHMVAALCDLVPFSDHGSKQLWLQQLKD